MFSVYAIISILSKRIYIGQARDLEKRLVMHNAGYVKSTKNELPWELISSQELNSREEARYIEFTLKKSLGKRNKWISENEATPSEGFQPIGGSTPEGERIRTRPS